jgi:hypothetical protein
MTRRILIALLAVTLLAGCTSTGGGATGDFELLVSDQPADIGDFSSLTVTFSEARVFPASASDADTDDDTNETDEEADEPANETEQDVNETDDADESEYRTIDISGRSVDLTTVIGMNATSLVNASLPTGNYSKIELHVTEAVGMVNGSEVNVKVPSEKLQLTKSFTISPNTTTSFVFDIHVVKRGMRGDYILRPVITASGVVGDDVEEPQRRGGDQDGPDRDDGRPNSTDGGPPADTATQ